MFESNDWDLDQDLFNDADAKAIDYYSQLDNRETSVKKRKAGIDDSPVGLPNLDSLKTGRPVDKEENKQSRKNLILGLFNENSSDKNVSLGASTESKRSCDNLPNQIKSIQDCNRSGYYSQLDRRETITKKPKIDTDDSPARLPNAASLKTEEDKQSRKNLILGLFKENSLDKNVSRGASIEPKRSCDNSSNQNDIKSTQASDRLLRKNLVLGILQSNNSQNREIAGDNAKKPKFESNSKGKSKNDVFKSPQKKMTLVRKFPGPAGLLPDDIDSNVACVSYLKNLEETEVRENKEPVDLPKYCSQNTTNLFTEGAWQSMLNDLPRDFLNGYDIASVNRKAAQDGSSNIKVKFLAGIVEQIDFNYENPPIILKDFTDSIRGIVHKDIPLKYPGLLDSNVVLLLRDVSLLKTSSTFALTNKYQILISPSSLLAIYDGKGKTQRTEYIESIFRDSVNRTVKEGRTIATVSSADSHNARDDKKEIKFDDDDDDADILVNLDSDLSFLFPSEATDTRNDFNGSTSKMLAEKRKKKQNSGESSREKENLSSGGKEKTKAKSALEDLKRFAFSDQEENVASNLGTWKTGTASREKKLTEIESDPDDELLSQMDIDFIT